VTSREECREAAELIPWVVSGTASAEDTRAVHRHIAGCDGCRTDFVRAVVLQRRITQAVSALPAADLRIPAAETAPGRRPAVREAGLLTRLASLAEALGTPRIAVQAMRLVAQPVLRRPAWTVNVPLVATVRIGR